MISDIFIAGSLLLIGVYMTAKYEKRFLLSFVIVSLLAFPSELNPSVRTLIHIADFIIVSYLYFREYGFDLKKYPKIPGIMVIFLMVFYSALIVSTWFSDYTMQGVYLIFQTSIFLLLIYALYGIINTKEDINLLVLSLMISGFILSGSIVVQFFLMGGNLVDPIRFRNFGFYSNINTSGLYIIILFPLTLATFYLDSFRKFRFISVSLLVLLSVSVIMIASRVAFFGVILGTSIMFFYLNRRAFIIFFSVFSSLALIHIIFNPFGPAVDIALRLEEGLSQHDHFWQLAINIIKDNPWLGIGPGAYSYIEFKYFPVMFESYPGQVMIYINQVAFGSNNSHNFYLVFASDMGILGVVASIFFPFTFFKLFISTWKNSPSAAKEVKIILASILAVGICLFLRSFGESIGLLSYGAISTDLPFWLLIIIMISYHQKKIEDAEVITE